ncbi:MAG: hypothetical protein Q8M95_02855 [Candidatus Methanoperedens sp.]|nr:hypothetical protein [Candidatus Methanoperedens sp.]
MNTVLDPVILFIPETEWYEEKNQIEFLDHLIDNLENIDQYSLTKIYWNDDLELYLWASPQMPPWRLNRDWNNQLLPIIYKFLIKNKVTLNFVNGRSSCTVSPSMNKCHSDNINDYFLKLMHEIINREEDIFLCLGIKNKLSNNDKYSFVCTCHSNRLVPEPINKPDDWLYHIDLENNYWPNNIEDDEKFRKAIEIMKKRDFNNKPLLYKYNFSKQFIRDILHINRDKKNILESITKKLTLSRQEANRDLHDEYLPRRKKFRFRVTQETRIHYLFSDEKGIEFLRYYGEGEHDDGL